MPSPWPLTVAAAILGTLLATILLWDRPPLLAAGLMIIALLVVRDHRRRSAHPPLPTAPAPEKTTDESKGELMVHTWEDGFGRWHALADNEDDALDAITSELEARDAIGVGYVVKVEEYDQGKYREAWEDDDDE